MIQRDPYYDIKAVSNSSLGYIDPADGGSPQKFKQFIDGNLKEDKASHFINGTLIHMSILEPERFVIADVMKPAAALGDIADALIIQNLELNDENILKTIEAFSWQNNWKRDTKVKKFKDGGGIEYVEYMQNLRNTNKIGMDKNTGTTVDACKSALLLNETAKYLLVDVDEKDGFETHNEFEIMWKQTINGVELTFKAKLDRIIIDHNTKSFCIVDVKTTGKPVGSFQHSFESYGYGRQVKFYKKAAQEYLKEKGMEDYKFDQAFIACVETSSYHTAQVFDVTKYVSDKKTTQDLLSLLHRVAYHYNTANWIEPMESQENGGVIELVPSSCT